ncbi:MAG: Bro-N domain-containing protein [Bacteroidota bacterium]|nr:Bro-N domain-containing protein [Bacteroidota bacterium]
MSNLKIFEGADIRAKWNDDEDQWWFVIQDVIRFLTDSPDSADYWYRLKKRVAENEEVELSTICRQLKFEAPNKKVYKYECANNEGLFRIIQSVPSPKAEPFKRWLAQLGKERIEEIEQPEKAMQRAKEYYEYKGQDKEWVNDRVHGVAS